MEWIILTTSHIYRLAPEKDTEDYMLLYKFLPTMELKTDKVTRREIKYEEDPITMHLKSICYEEGKRNDHCINFTTKDESVVISYYPFRTTDSWVAKKREEVITVSQQTVYDRELKKLRV